MKKEQNVPVLRFQGCSGVWERKTLSDIVDINNGQDYKALGEGTIPVYGTGGYMLSVDRALSYEKDAIGIGRKGTIDNPFILRAPFWTVDTLFYAIPKEKYDLDFIWGIFKNVDWRSKDESTGVPSLSKVIISKIVAYTPLFIEQQKIGELLTRLNRQEQLLQNKIQKLQQFRQAMLTKLFPREGAVEPELRFRGFSGKWERQKLADVVDVQNGYDYKSLGKGTIPVYGTGGYMLSVDKALSYEKDAIGIGRKGTIDKPFILRAPFWTVDTLFYAIPREINDINFVMCLFQKIDWKGKNESTGVPSLSKSTIEEVKVLIPSAMEQKAIGNFFYQLDSYISLQKKKLERMQRLKGALLEKLFV